MGEWLISDDDDYCYLGGEEEYDDRDYLDGFEDVENQSPWPKSTASSTKVITKQSLLLAQRQYLEQVMDLLSLKEHHARALLIHYRWDVEKIIAVLVEDGKDMLYAAAGLKVVELDGSFPTQSSSLIMCLICMEDVSSKEVTAMDCGHCFCNSCWTEHFIVKINEGRSRSIKCMAHKCNAICDEAKVGNLVGAKDPGLAEKYDRFILESYIEDNKMVKWCPSVPHCGNAIRVEDDEFCEVECVCGLQFCFNCLSEAHSPCSCLMWKLWRKKCQDESETVNWLTIHTQPCPKCHKSVEKNGGCNLVVCVCGQAFCWLCGGATGKDHTYTYISDHSCGRYKEDHQKKAVHAKRELKRYIHYYNRYKAHIDSLEFESKLKETIPENISKLDERESTIKDFSWVSNGLHRLFRSRCVLSYSYPFAYFMFGDDLSKNEMTKEERENKQLLFEDQQQQLEANVEKLSLLLEEPFSEYSDNRVQELRLKIISLSVVTDKCCEKLYECIDNDLLGPLQRVTHIIALYKSKGVEKASELSVYWDNNGTENIPGPDGGVHTRTI